MKLNFSFCLFLMVSMVLVSSMAHAGIQLWDFDKIGNEKDWEAVSYTHLTLPTIYSV